MTMDQEIKKVSAATFDLVMDAIGNQDADDLIERLRQLMERLKEGLDYQNKIDPESIFDHLVEYRKALAALLDIIYILQRLFREQCGLPDLSEALEPLKQVIKSRRDAADHSILHRVL